MQAKTESRFEFRSRARRRALQALYQWHLTGLDVGEIIAQFREEQDFSNVDTELFATLVRKVSKDQLEFDEKIEPFLDRPIKQLDVIEHVILSMGAYELLNSIEVPHQVHVARDATMQERLFYGALYQSGIKTIVNETISPKQEKIFWKHEHHDNNV